MIDHEAEICSHSGMQQNVFNGFCAHPCSWNSWTSLTWVDRHHESLWWDWFLNYYFLGHNWKKIHCRKKKPEQTPHQVISHPTSKWDGKNSPNYIISTQQLICPSQFVPIPGTKQEVSTPTVRQKCQKVFSWRPFFSQDISSTCTTLSFYIGLFFLSTGLKFPPTNPHHHDFNIYTMHIHSDLTILKFYYNKIFI